MVEIVLTVRNEVGLHSRPAAMLVEMAQSYQSEINIHYNERVANAKSILSVLTLGVNKGATILLHAEGCDEKEAVEALEALVEGNFGEAAEE
jgi:phosphocarrier protein